MILIQYESGMDPLLYYILFCLFISWYWFYTNGLVLLLHYDSGMDPLLSYSSVYLGLSFLDGDVPRSTSYGVYISQLICFARASGHVTDFKTRIKLLTQNFLNKAISIINFANYFLNFIDDTMT